MSRLFWIVSLALLTGYINGEIRISLNSNTSNKWIVRNESSSESKPATVPGGIYSDLNLVDDLFYDTNDEHYKWVGYENWTYETSFELSQDILDMFAVNLVLHGIDTVGDVYLNGQHLQSVNNMFVRYVIPIKHVATVGTNTLEILLRSPITTALELAQANGYEKLAEANGYAIPPKCPLSEAANYGDCHVSFLRKMQASFGWRWGPSVPSVGIWKSVEIEAFDTAIVRNVGASITETTSGWLVDIECYCEGVEQGYGYILGMELTNSYSKNSNLKNRLVKHVPYVERAAADDNKYSHFIHKTTMKFEKDKAQPWWPNGYGQQPLWKLSCELLAPGENRTIIESSKQSTVTALRTIELIQEESRNPRDGLSFYFKVNGVPIFVKGANWVPSHILPELASDEKTLRKLLQSAKDANMNMLRVPGSGIYESDLFYQIADELGILIWQDMMFSSTLYPADAEFLQSVSLEVDQQIKRLKAHPSVVIWNGNNEIEEILATNRFQIENQTQYIQDYITLFVDTIKPIVENRDPSLYYATSSPSNGKKTEEDGNIAGNPNDPLYGDVHYYNYNIDPWNMSSYSTGNIISEYGFQSMPSLLTLSKALKPGDLKLSSLPSILRQHLVNGYDIMERLIKSNLPLQNNGEPEEFYKDFIYYSQIMQAMATKIETETYRVKRMSGEIKGTMGTLFSQLNDVWQAPTWSSIEYGGRWKMLHYYAAKFFAPVGVVPYLLPDGDTLQIYDVTEPQNIDIYQISFSVYSWDSFSPRNPGPNGKMLRGLKSDPILDFSITKWLQLHQCDKTTCFFYFTLKGGRIFAENFFFPSSFSEVTNLKPATIETSLRQSSNKNEVIIDITTDRIAPFVWLETDMEGTFSDNGFTMITETKTITFANKEETSIDIEKLRSTLKVRSLLRSGNGAGRITNNMIIVPLFLTFLNYVKKLW